MYYFYGYISKVSFFFGKKDTESKLKGLAENTVHLDNKIVLRHESLKPWL